MGALPHCPAPRGRPGACSSGPRGSVQGDAGFLGSLLPLFAAQRPAKAVMGGVRLTARDTHRITNYYKLDSYWREAPRVAAPMMAGKAAAICQGDVQSAVRGWAILWPHSVARLRQVAGKSG